MGRESTRRCSVGGRYKTAISLVKVTRSHPQHLQHLQHLQYLQYPNQPHSIRFHLATMTTSTSTSISVLSFGLSVDYVRRNAPPGTMDVDALDRLLAASEAKLTTYDPQRLSARMQYYALDEPATIQAIQDTIRTGDPATSRPWDAVVIGFGLRGNKMLTVAFEEMVNYVRENAPGAKLLFSDAPDTHLEAIQRNFPHLR